MPYIGNKPATTAVQIGADQVISSTIADGAIVNSDLNSSAAIAATKIADGSVTSAEFQYINTLSSNAQTQLDAKAPLASPTFTGVVTAPDLTISGTSTTIGTVTSGIWNAGAIASTAGISGTTGTFSGDVDVKRLKVNGGWAFEDVGSGTLRIGEGQTTLQHYGNSTFAGDVTVSGRDIQTGSANSLNLGDDSSVISIGKTNEMWVQDSTNAEASLYINHRGYAQEQTQFRNFVVSDGKGNQILNLQGEEKSATFSGEIGVTQNSGNLAIYNDGSGHGIVATGSSKNLTIQADNDLKLYADGAFMADWWVSGSENYVKFRSHATVDETLTVTGNATFAGGITTGDYIALSKQEGWSPKITITNTDNGSTPGQIQFWKRPADGAISDNDMLGQITFSGINSADQDTYYTILRSHVLDETDGSEDSAFYIDNYVNGTGDVNALKIEGTTSTFAGTISNTGLIYSQQTAHADGIRFRGYDAANGYYGKIGLIDNGYLRIHAEGNRSIDLYSGRQIRFYTSTDNSTYTNSVNFNSDGTSTFTGVINASYGAGNGFIRRSDQNGNTSISVENHNNDGSHHAEIYIKDSVGNLTMGYSNNYSSSQWQGGWVYTSSGDLMLKSAAAMEFMVGGHDNSHIALDIDTSKNATFAGDVKLSSGKKVYFGGARVAIGYAPSVTADNSVGIGYAPEASGANSFAFGYNSKAQGDNSFVVGYANTVSGDNSIGIGYNMSVTGNNSVGLGYSSTVSTDNLFFTDLNFETSGNATVAGTLTAEGDITQSNVGAYSTFRRTKIISRGNSVSSATWRADGYTESWDLSDLGMGDHVYGTVTVYVYHTSEAMHFSLNQHTNTWATRVLSKTSDDSWEDPHDLGTSGWTTGASQTNGTSGKYNIGFTRSNTVGGAKMYISNRIGGDRIFNVTFDLNA